MALPRLRKSTIAFLVLVAAVILLANIPGQAVSEPNMDALGKCGPDFPVDIRCHHGWPLTFLVQETKWPFSPWNFNERVVDSSWWRLAVDGFVGFIVLLLAGMGFERWRRRRGRFQFCLIDFFAIVTLVACGFAYWRTMACERDRQAETIKQLKASAGLVSTEQEVEWSSGGPSWLRNWQEDQPLAAGDRVVGIWVNGKGLAHLSQLPNLKVVRVLVTTLSNEQIDTLRNLPDLEALLMSAISICGEEEDDSGRRKLTKEKGCIRLPPMPNLRGLNLWGTPFRGNGLEYLTGIEVLDLTDTDIGDDAMPKFESMRNLTRLSLLGTYVTDAGLAHLAGLKHLRLLEFSDDKVTENAVALLRQSLPDCAILRQKWRRNMNM